MVPSKNGWKCRLRLTRNSFMVCSYYWVFKKHIHLLQWSPRPMISAVPNSQNVPKKYLQEVFVITANYHPQKPFWWVVFIRVQYICSLQWTGSLCWWIWGWESVAYFGDHRSLAPRLLVYKHCLFSVWSCFCVLEGPMWLFAGRGLLAVRFVVELGILRHM